MIDKAKFYEALKPFRNKHLPINFFLRFGENLCYELIFNWQNENHDGSFNPTMYAQLVDTRKSGSKRYIVPDLMWNCRDEGTTTDFKLFRFLDKWAAAAIEEYERAGHRGWME